MKRHPEYIVNEAKQLLLKKNLNYKEISQHLNVPESTVSIWCRNLENSKLRSLVRNNEAKRQLFKEQDLWVTKKLNIDNRTAKILSAIIYGCEGSKYPSTGYLALANCDPSLVLTFVNLLRRGFEIDNSKFRVHLQIHSNQNYSELVKFWSNLLDIPKCKFYKPTITTPNGKKHRTNYLGTCTVRYYDYKLQLSLIGIFEEFMRKLCKLEDGPDGKAQVC